MEMEPEALELELEEPPARCIDHGFHLIRLAQRAAAAAGPLDSAHIHQCPGPGGIAYCLCAGWKEICVFCSICQLMGVPNLYP